VADRKPEEEYFARVEAEQKEKLRQQIDAESAVAAAEQLRLLHWHKCGKCGNDMTTHMFRGQDIEVCGHCGSVLLDKGELEAFAGHDRSGVFASIATLFGGSKG
jgi:hypothetical protein